jgi:hypothetical protein
MFLSWTDPCILEKSYPLSPQLERINLSSTVNKRLNEKNYQRVCG